MVHVYAHRNARIVAGLHLHTSLVLPSSLLAAVSGIWLQQTSMHKYLQSIQDNQTPCALLVMYKLQAW